MFNLDELKADLCRDIAKETDYSKGHTIKEWTEIFNMGRSDMGAKIRKKIELGEWSEDKDWRPWGSTYRKVPVYRPV